MEEIVKTKANYILNVDFPEAMDVEDPNDARFVSLADMKHWELAPTNLAAFEKANVTFSISSSDLKDSKTFLTNLRKAIRYGLSETKALEALTKTPATMLGVYDQVGSLEAGKWANFIITTEPIFATNAKIIENWVQGNKYEVAESEWNNYAGKYKLTLNTGGTNTEYNLEVKKDLSASIIGTDTLAAKITINESLVKITFPNKKGRGAEQIRLGGAIVGANWSGIGTDPAGNKNTWTASLVGPMTSTADTRRNTDTTKPLAKIKIGRAHV